MNWDDLRIFNAVVLRGGLAAGAKAAGVAEPTARRRLRALEDRVGLALMRRTVGGLAATPAGVALSAPVLAMAARAAAGVGVRADTDTDAMAGVVRILFDERLTLDLILPLVARWADSYSNLIIELVISNTRDYTPDPTIDIVISRSPLVDAREDARLVTHLTRGLFASRAYLDEVGPPSDLAAIRGVNLIGTAVENHNLPILREGNSDVEPRDIGFRTDSRTARRAAIRAGVGVGIDFVESVDDPDVIRVLPHFAAQAPVWTALPGGDRASERARRLRGSMDEHLTSLGGGAATVRGQPDHALAGAT